MNGEVDLNAILTTMNEIRDSQKEMVTRIATLEDNHRKAFPGGDFEGHRRYHESIVEILEEKRKMRVAIQEKTISALVWVFIIGVGTAVWHELIRCVDVAKQVVGK